MLWQGDLFFWPPSNLKKKLGHDSCILSISTLCFFLMGNTALSYSLIFPNPHVDSVLEDPHEN